MKKLKKAFTLTEVMVALGVIGILVAVLIPVIYNLIPDQNTLMAKRSYYALQSVIADMLNDTACYPDKSMLPDARKRIGFGDESRYDECDAWNGDAEPSDTAYKKFVTIFADRLGGSIPTDHTIGNGTTTITTSDGIVWEFNNGTSYYKDGISDGVDVGDGYFILSVDVNGGGAPNCSQATQGLAEECSDKSTRTSGWDSYSVKISQKGDLIIADDWTIAAVNANEDIVKRAGKAVAEDDTTSDPIVVNPGIVGPGVGKDPKPGVIKDPVDQVIDAGKIDGGKIIKDPIQAP